MNKLTILVGLALALAVALPDGTEATSFNEVKKLTASDAQAGDEFGGSVAVSGGTAVVGANVESDGGLFFAGAAYIFRRDEGGADNWGEMKKLTASDAQANDGFGWSVAVSGDTAVVGAPGEDAGGFSAGAVYVFEPPVPTPTATVPPPVGGSGVFPEIGGAGASGGNAGLLAGVAVAVAAGAVALGGAAWWVRKRGHSRGERLLAPPSSLHCSYGPDSLP